MRRNAAKRVERHAAESDNEWRCDDLELCRQEVAAGGDFAGAWAPIVSVRSARVAEHRVRDEDSFAGDSGIGEEGVKAAAGDIGRHWNARANGAQPAGRFGYEEDIGIQGAVHIAQDVNVVHVRTGEALANARAEVLKVGHVVMITCGSSRRGICYNSRDLP